MKTLTITEIFPYKAADLKKVALDAANYPQISSWVKQVRVVPQGGGVTQIDAVLKVPLLPASIAYGCRLLDESQNKIQATATKCTPFKSMGGVLTFNSVANGHTEIVCDLIYEHGMLSPLRLLPDSKIEAMIRDSIEDTLRPYLARTLTPIG